MCGGRTPFICAWTTPASWFPVTCCPNSKCIGGWTGTKFRNTRPSSGNAASGRKAGRFRLTPPIRAGWLTSYSRRRSAGSRPPFPKARPPVCGTSATIAAGNAGWSGKKGTGCPVTPPPATGRRPPSLPTPRRPTSPNRASWSCCVGRCPLCWPRKRMMPSDPHPPRRFPEAHYHKALPALYLGNPLIEALPPILMAEEAAQRLAHFPPFSPAERRQPAEWRFHSLQSVLHLFVPLSPHLQLEQRFSRVIRRGYLARNPLARAHWQQVDAGIEALQQGAGPPVPGGLCSTATAFTILGISGVGKTTAIQRILNLYPQVIQHHRYGQRPLLLTQIAWLKLECPHAGSVRGLCSDFFTAVDNLLGTNYYYNYANRGRATVDQMIPAMARVASIHKIGVLIIDEIQHLSEAKSGGSARMLNFFVQLVNTIGMPVILIGTPKARHLLSREFRQARRSTGEGDPIWDRMREDALWRLFLEALWPYQYLRHPVPLDDTLSHILYDETQGITDLVVKLFMAAQMRAMSSGVETLTPAILRSAAADLMRIVAPALDALRRNDRFALQQFEDIALPDLDGYIRRAQADLKQRERREKKKSSPGKPAVPSADPSSSPGATKSGKKKPSRDDRHRIPSPDDLRRFQTGEKEEDTAQALREAGVAQSLLDFLDAGEEEPPS
ncbi:MAG: AAA family ATPase [Anaerolineae bacterium]|nr:MAG: AAA family ATPase [Anaerolineae bacterium]